MAKKRILLLVHEDLVPPESVEGVKASEVMKWRTEYDVAQGLTALRHEVLILGVRSDLGVIRNAIEEFRPHIAFNLLEEFHGVALYDQHVVSYLELLRVPYTGCNPRGLTLCHDKALCRKVLAYHRVPGPRFALIPIGRRTRVPSRMRYPLFVKSATEDASLGISQASVVADEAALRERVEFIHDSVGTDALVEEYIDGRELYVGILGNQRLQTLPVLEMTFPNLPPGALKIATEKIKWDESYQRRIGLKTETPKDLDENVVKRVHDLTRRIYRILGLSGYARLDLRLTEEGVPHLIEVNPNPDLAADDLLAEAGEMVGYSYKGLVQKIVNLGLRYRAMWAQ
jgi:D-alanine-D-alanine ligase